MSTTLASTPPWPPMPDAHSAGGSRMAWYAAVARWAPSKHNTQPWRFVVDDAFLEFRTDATRALADTDPQMREMVISTGAAVHLATVAARAAGYEVAVTLVPDGRGGGTARMEEIGPRTPTANDLDLLAAVPNRRTDRGPLDGDQLPADLPFVLQSAAAELGSSLRLVTSPGDRLTLADLVQRADRLLLQRGTADAELVNWLRTPTDRRRDGVPADHTRGPSASSRAEFVQRDFSLPGTQPTQDRAGRDRPLVGVLCTPADGVSDWLAAGRALGAVLLRATLAGANASYLNQPVEDVAIRAQLRDQLTLDGVAQLVLRIGVGGEVAVTPRRYLRDLIHRP